MKKFLHKYRWRQAAQYLQKYSSFNQCRALEAKDIPAILEEISKLLKIDLLCIDSKEEAAYYFLACITKFPYARYRLEERVEKIFDEMTGLIYHDHVQETRYGYGGGQFYRMSIVSSLFSGMVEIDTIQSNPKIPDSIKYHARKGFPIMCDISCYFECEDILDMPSQMLFLQYALSILRYTAENPSAYFSGDKHV